MFCLAGRELIGEFEAAKKERAAAKDEFLRSKGKQSAEALLHRAKAKHDDAFVAWVTHRSFCIEWRAIPLPRDIAQFASV